MPSVNVGMFSSFSMSDAGRILLITVGISTHILRRFEDKSKFKGELLRKMYLRKFPNPVRIGPYTWRVKESRLVLINHPVHYLPVPSFLLAIPARSNVEH